MKPILLVSFALLAVNVEIEPHRGVACLRERSMIDYRPVEVAPGMTTIRPVRVTWCDLRIAACVFENRIVADSLCEGE